MAEYTMELRQIVNSDCHQVFDFTYPFYCDESVAKKEFEELFINRYYFHEIGAETIERWQHQLKARLMTIMPYYTQLYQTEWYNVKTKELMMTSKNVKDTYTKEVVVDDLNQSTTKQNDISSGSSHQTSSSQSTHENEQQLNETSSTLLNQTQEQSEQRQSTSSSTGESSGNGKSSSIQDGVGVVNLTDGLTEQNISETSTQASSEDSVSATSENHLENDTQTQGQQSSNESGQEQQEQNLTNTSQATNLLNGESESKSQMTQKETYEFTSIGDIGIQTPAYAITEWRKIIININEMILNDCKDLFMLIY